MNRRQFLQSLAAIGTALAIPTEALSKASQAEIDSAWQELASAPRTFYVADCGAISSSFGPEYPTTRSVLLNLADPPGDDAQLPAYIKSDAHIERYVERLFDRAYDAGEADDDTDRDEWISTNADRLHHELEKWVNDDPDGTDWEYADLEGLTGRGDALKFFRDQRDTAKVFNIAIVLGVDPGSSYYAAELQMDVTEANALAEQQGVPIRFEYDDDEV